MAVLRSLLFYAAFYGGSVFYAAAAFLVAPFSRPMLRRAVYAWSDWHRTCVRLLLGIRIEITGELPPGPVLVAIKHESFFEAIDMPRLLAYPVVFAKAPLLRIPLWGPAAFRYGVVPVQREQGAAALRAMLGAARKWSAEQRPLAIFPEGKRVAHGTRPPLQAGFAGLYKLIGLPVVPVAVDTGAIYHHRWKKRGTIRLAFGETIPAGLPRAEIEARVHAAINALNPEDDAPTPQPG